MPYSFFEFKPPFPGGFFADRRKILIPDDVKHKNAFCLQNNNFMNAVNPA